MSGKFDFMMASKATDLSFDALIMGAVLRADTQNLHLLTLSFPGLVKEARERYNNPGGMTNEELAQSRDNPEQWLSGSSDGM